ncbi:MAG TPA: BTAD domain-containing putative transcriptional regulator [Rugosimonospora sp.]
MQFCVLGPIEARASDGRLVRLGAEKHRVVLAVLLLEANRWVGASRLTEALWPDSPPRSAASALRTYVSALRAALLLGAPGSPAEIVGRHGGYQLRVPASELDLLVFEDLAERGQKALLDGDVPLGAELLQRGLRLWRGRALEDIPVDPGLVAQLGRLEELRLGVLEASVEARLGLGQHADLVAELGAAVAAQPLRERLHALWMLALYRCGQQAEALSAFRTLRGELVRELGIEPGPPLQQLHRQILAADPALDPPDRELGPPYWPPVRPPVVPRQLPPDVGGFTGRAEETARLVRLLRGGRLGGAASAGGAPAGGASAGGASPGGPPAGGASAGGVPVIAAIDGVPGVGKSTLAVRVAHQVAARYPDGQLYADLRGADSRLGPAAPLAVLGSFLRALGASDGDVASLDEAAARFRALTADRRMLVLLDNARDAAQIQPLLPASGGCAVLVTGRRILSTVDGAMPVHLDVLPAAEAVALLGRLVGTGRVDADPAAADQVVRLCDQLPLALRIAAARLAARPGWPVRALADRLADAQRRLDELQAGDLGVRASFQVSLRALRDGAEPADQAAGRAFAALGVLDVTDLGVPVAARLLDEPEPTAEAALERLVDAQLLASPVPGRYRLHDLLRLFAVECAAAEYSPDERTAGLVRALSWYRDAALETLRLLRPGHGHPGLAGRERVAAPAAGWPFGDVDSALRWLDTERGNLVAAIGQAVRDPGVPADIAVSTAQALFGFFLVRGHWHDWIQVNRAILGLAERVADPTAAGHAHRDLGVAHDQRGDFDLAGRHLEESLSIFTRLGDRIGRAASLTSLGVLHHRHGRYREAVACQRESLAIRRELGDQGGQAINLTNLGASHQRLDEYDEAEACYQEGLEIVRRLGDRRGTAAIFGNIGIICFRRGHYAAAIDRHRQGLDLFRELGDRTATGHALNNLGLALRAVGRYDEALDCQREALAIAVQSDERYLRGECLREMGSIWYSQGDAGRATMHWELARSVFAELGVPDAAEVAELLTAARSSAAGG